MPIECHVGVTGGLARSIQEGHANFTYKGIPTWKCPFDLAIYSMLLWEVKPATIIEIGTHAGGSALWLRDTMRAYGLNPLIISIDRAPTFPHFPGIVFAEGDARNLQDILPDIFPRPLFVIEDADHRPETTLAVLRFFDARTGPGDHIIVEDGIVHELYHADFAGGPLVAIRQFLSERGGDWEIDRRWCDFFGKNVTWNLDGYLRRKGG